MYLNMPRTVASPIEVPSARSHPLSPSRPLALGLVGREEAGHRAILEAPDVNSLESRRGAGAALIRIGGIKRIFGVNRDPLTEAELL